MLSPGDSPKAVRLKDGLISPLLLILLGVKGAPPNPTAPPLCLLAKRFYLSSASSSASPPPPPSRTPRNQRNHHAEPLLLFSVDCFHRRGGQTHWARRLWSPHSRHRFTQPPAGEQVRLDVRVDENEPITVRAHESLRHWAPPLDLDQSGAS